MPFPAAHALAGYAVYQVSKKREAKFDWKLAAYCAFMGNFADLDFLPGLFMKQAAKFHHGIMHSFGAAILVGVLAALIYQFWRKKDFVKAFLITSVCYSSHIVLDIIRGAWQGMPVFWPMTSQRFFGNPLSAKPGGEDCLMNADIHDFLHFLTSPQRLLHIASEFSLFVILYLLFKIGVEIFTRFRNARRTVLVLREDKQPLALSQVKA